MTGIDSFKTYPAGTGGSKELKTIAYGKIKIITACSDKSGTLQDYRWKVKDKNE